MNQDVSRRAFGVVRALWRYPVKSLAPQRLDEALIAHGGIPGDRGSALFAQSGHARIGQTYRGKEHELLHTISDARQAQQLAAGRGVQTAIRSGEGVHYFDSAPVSIVLDRWVDEVSTAVGRRLEPLRWRPNLYVEAAPGAAFSEADLVGCTIEAGEARLRVRAPIKRCVVVTYDLRTGEPEPQVLHYIAQHRANTFGIYCDVEAEGIVRLGDVLRFPAH